MFSRIKYRLMVLKKILLFSSGVKRFFYLLLLISMLSTTLGFATPMFYKLFIDEVVLEGDFSKMLVVVAGYLVIFFTNVTLDYLKIWADYKFVNTVTYRVRCKILHNFFVLPFSAYETMGIGDMKMRIDDDTGQIKAFAGCQTVDYLAAYTTLLISGGVLIAIDWRLASFSIVAIPLTFWLDSIISRKEKVLNDSTRENSQEFSGWLHVSVQSWHEIKALNLSRRQERIFVKYCHIDALNFAKWINYWTARVLVIPKIKDEFFMRFGLYFIGGLLIILGDLKISNLLVFAMYYEMLSGAIKEVSCADADLQAYMPLMDRLMSSIGLHGNGSDNKGIVPERFNNTFCLSHVHFSYPDTRQDILCDVSLTIKKGEKIAIAGRSGCGKTTLLKLMTGMIMPTSGNISFSGIDLKDIDMASMHSKIGFVMQENLLFNTNIRDNLLYGKDSADEEELREACRKACILDFINSLPNGFDTLVGEGGIKLSGGQRQRIVLARLFLRNVDIFILDEATSALDQYSEEIVYDAIRSIFKDKTVIVVTHRESSIRLCERKIEIKDLGCYELY